jgi:lipopolysaccharide export LptBFGC system permease protein LptF
MTWIGPVVLLALFIVVVAMVVRLWLLARKLGR